MKRGLFSTLSFAAIAFAAGCSAEDPEQDDPKPLQPFGGVIVSGTGGSSAAANPAAIPNYNRPPGMPIGQGAAGPDADEDGLTPSDVVPAAGSTSDPEDNSDIEIPTFEDPEQTAPPCSGCIELNMDVTDINQRDEFVFNAGGLTGVTSVVWTLIIPFNSDQLFVQPFVDSAYGTYTDLDANAWTIGTPVEFVHTFTGTANNVGLAIGSAGAWTGNMRMAVFVDSVRLVVGTTSVSRTFDTSAEGMAPRSASRNPGLIHHPLQ